MNKYIQKILDDQFRSYELGEMPLSAINLDDEDILFSIDEKEISIGSSKELTEGHRYRLSLIAPYIQNALNKTNIKKANIIICLGDILNKQYSGIPVICFSKPQNIGGIVIPNTDFFDGTLLNVLKESSNDIEYTKKNNSSLFIGSSTGPFKNNTRILFGQKCLLTQRHKCNINNLCQASPEEWESEYPYINNLLMLPLNITEQLQNKIVINIDGNTVCWSRLYWQMNSNSIPVYINKNKKEIQFLDYGDSDGAYVECDLENAIETLDEILDNYTDHQINFINNKGKEFCDKYLADYIDNPQQFLQHIIDNIIQTLFINTDESIK